MHRPGCGAHTSPRQALALTLSLPPHDPLTISAPWITGVQQHLSEGALGSLGCPVGLWGDGQHGTPDSATAAQLGTGVMAQDAWLCCSYPAGHWGDCKHEMPGAHRLTERASCPSGNCCLILETLKRLSGLNILTAEFPGMKTRHAREAYGSPSLSSEWPHTRSTVKTELWGPMLWHSP